jgi:hypothetical protein
LIASAVKGMGDFEVLSPLAGEIRERGISAPESEKGTPNGDTGTTS